MKHLGDIKKIHGYKVPTVDVICGGSPCQDLSVAGKRAGLVGERSGLFMDQIRIIREMREHDRAVRGADVDRGSVRPRYMVWENVPGAFSSNKGEDFRAVLEETSKVADETAIIPGPPKGKWAPAGCIMGDGWSIAWRVHDAQFWGVPQRRKRISLVADFGGETAPEILFERKSVSRDFEESRKPGESTPANVGSSVEETGRSVMGQGFAMQAIGEYKDCDCASSLKQRDYKDATDLIVGSFYPQMKAESQCFRDDNISNTLVNGTNPGFQNGVCYGLDRAAYNQGQNAKYDFSVEEEKIATQTAKGPGAVLPWTNSIVRRLTPMECERLQGYPDGWTDISEWTDSKGKLHKDADSPRYKALGNSIALPFWEWMAEQMAKQLKVDGADHPTMASLFDGIGGFPLVFSRVGIYPIWASEIEEFPIAVTKHHFPEDNKGTITNDRK